MTINLVDWDWVGSAPSAQTFLEVMLEDDEADEKFMDWSPAFGEKWAGNAHYYARFSDTFGRVVTALADQNQSAKLKRALGPFFSWNAEGDDIGVRAFPDECFIGALSPQTVSHMQAYCTDLDLCFYSSIFAEHMAPGDAKGADEDVIERYLSQWVDAVNEAAAAKTHGVLVHMG